MVVRQYDSAIVWQWDSATVRQVRQYDSTSDSTTVEQVTVHVQAKRTNQVTVAMIRTVPVESIVDSTTGGTIIVSTGGTIIVSTGVR